VLDVDLYDSMNQNQIYILLCFTAAQESAELIRFLHKFGKLMFEILSSKSRYIVYERVIRLASLVLVKTSVELQRMAHNIGVDRGEKVFFEDYELFFYQLFSEMDSKQENLRLYYYQNNRVVGKVVKLKSNQEKGTGSYSQSAT